jgi:hypothetical protein
MTAITAANSSATNAVASLLSNAASSATTDADSTAAKATTSDPAASSASRAPVDTVDLSDRAKATLARAKTERVAADKLATLVQTLKGQGSDKTKSEVGSTDPQDIFQKLSGGAATNKDLEGYLNSLTAANKNSDGTYNSFSKTVDDVLIVPSTPQQVDDWYKNAEQAVTGGVKVFTNEDYQVYAQAVLNRIVTIQSAKDIPDLNFHNTWTLQGGEGGRSINGTSSYNHDASIFKDPTTNYIVSGNGTVISWPKPPATGTTTSPPQ